MAEECKAKAAARDEALEVRASQRISREEALILLHRATNWMQWASASATRQRPAQAALSASCRDLAATPWEAPGPT